MISMLRALLQEFARRERAEVAALLVASEPELGDEELELLRQSLEGGSPGQGLYALARAGQRLPQELRLAALGSPSAELRGAAAESLLDEATPELYDRLPWSAEALSLLAACDVERARPELEAALQKLALQDAAAAALMRYTAVRPPLYRRLLESSEPLDRLRVVDILIHARAAPRSCLVLLEDPDVRVRTSMLTLVAMAEGWQLLAPAMLDPWCRERALALAPLEMLEERLQAEDRELVGDVLQALLDRGLRPQRELALEAVAARELRLISALLIPHLAPGSTLERARDQATAEAQQRLRHTLILLARPSSRKEAKALRCPPRLAHEPDPALWAELARHTHGAVGHRLTLLQGVGILSHWPTRSLGRLAEACSQRSAQAGETLLRQGGGGDEVLLLLDGEAEVLDGEVLLRRAGPGEALGELAALHPAPRSATVRATVACELLVLPGAALGVELRRGENAWPLIRSLVERISSLPRQAPAQERPAVLALGCSTPLQRALALQSCGVFRDLRPELVASLAARCTEHRLEHQDFLFERGDAASDLYIVVSGRLRVGEPEIARLNTGAIVGELAVLAELPRSESVRADGSVQLLALPREALLAQARETPDLTAGLIAVLVEKLRGRSSLGLVDR